MTHLTYLQNRGYDGLSVATVAHGGTVSKKPNSPSGQENTAMSTKTATIVVDGMGCQTVESWYGNLHLTINGTPVIVGVEYDSNNGYRVDFVRFIDSGGTSVYDAMDLTYETDLGWQGIPSPEQRDLLFTVMTLTGAQLEQMTAKAGRMDLEV